MISTRSSELSIRPARIVDASAVARIWHDGWRDAHATLVSPDLAALRTPESFQLPAAQRVSDTTIATVGPEVAGFTMVAEDELEQVYVAREHRGSGVAAALLAEAERAVADSGRTHAWLAVLGGNNHARRFYERHGWKDEGLIDYPAATATGPVILQAHRYTKRITDVPPAKREIADCRHDFAPSQPRHVTSTR